MTTTASVVAFRQVSKAYDSVMAVDGLTLTLYPGQTVALLGPNGAGKSTTLDLLLGLRNPDSGTIDLFGAGPREAITAGRVGAMLQSGGLMDEVTVAELVRLACALHPRPYPVVGAPVPDRQPESAGSAAGSATLSPLPGQAGAVGGGAAPAHAVAARANCCGNPAGHSPRW